MKSFSPSVARNKQPLLDALLPALHELQRAHGPSLRMVEVASGTGEHAALLASAVRGLTIQPVEPDAAMHGSIAAWAEDVAAAMAAPAVDAPSSSTAANTAANIATATSAVLPALGTDVRKLTTGALVSGFSPAHCILCVNMIHISPWECTEALFWSTGDVLAPGGLLWTYGPYKEGGTDGLGMCDSNVTFDESLRARDPEWGVRSVGAVEAAANAKGLVLVQRREMPANNLLLTWQRSATAAST